ncbi:eCIS core domain-containing protein [Natrinema pallidum]|uniref:eCIS core domain-containing protein n=1 Tax=Natrinema pallidum DSM 3751 TaxID=1227495 RepID=L9Z8F1_9EURY|nr:DUF4157 domain-containing protein [Natrinema pallidum]ELY82241.1 hypothetical protein C487_02413 [Natrinema pallidum DSM 3751]
MGEHTKRERTTRSKQSSDSRERDSRTTSRTESRSRTSDHRSGETRTRSADHDELIAGPAANPPTVPEGTALPAPGERARRKREWSIQRSLEGTDTTEGEVPGQVLDVIGSGGRPLEFGLQRTLEDRMDADFGNVRVHTGPKATQAAEAIDAKAFTCGNDIVFNAGEYDPQSADGQFLLAHELAHVKQQHGGAPLSMMPQRDADLEIDPDPGLEREADEAAKEALHGEDPLTVSRLGTEVHVQRTPKDLSGYLQGMTETEETVIAEGGTGTLLGIDPEKLEKLQSSVETLEEIAAEISDLSTEMGVTVDPAAGATTMREETPTPLADGLAVTVLHDADFTEMDLSSEQEELVRKHKQLVSEFQTNCRELIAELHEEDLPDENTFREFLVEAGVSSGVAAALYKAIESQTDYATFASMIQSEAEMVGSQGAGLLENITVAFGALLTGIALNYGKNKLTDDKTDEDEYSPEDYN